MSPRRSKRWPVILAIVMIVLLVALTIGWVILSVREALAGTNLSGLYWTLLSVGTVFLVLVLLGVIFYMVLWIKAVNLAQQQSNFIDAVTHELKSPIASLKLYLQTLGRHNVSEQEQASFVRTMLEDVERLDILINHLLEAARLEHEPVASEEEEVDVAALLTTCRDTVCQRHRVASDAVQVDLQPARIRARRVDVELIFSNLIDNAVKYAGSPPQAWIETSRTAAGGLLIRISDNGRGIPPQWRWKIFRRFVRLGQELEREKPGTGLGLYIVDTLVRRLRGQITVRDRTEGTGTVFEVRLPAAIVVSRAEPAPQSVSLTASQ
jgi:signal transduction histidine kinase